MVEFDVDMARLEDAGELDEVKALVDRLEEAEARNEGFKKLVLELWDDVLAFGDTPYYVEVQGNNPAVTWLKEDYTWLDERMESMHALGMTDIEGWLDWLNNES